MKVQQGVLQQNLSKFYEPGSAENVCNQFNNLINTLKKEEKIETGKRYPWVDKMDERNICQIEKYYKKYINLDNTCLQEEEKKEVMNMLYKYKEGFSLRDKMVHAPT